MPEVIRPTIEGSFVVQIRTFLTQVYRSPARPTSSLKVMIVMSNLQLTSCPLVANEFQPREHLPAANSTVEIRSVDVYLNQAPVICRIVAAGQIDPPV